MNATQIAIKDDEQLLRSIANEMKTDGKQSRDRFIFVVNKCDALDEEKVMFGFSKDVSPVLIKNEKDDKYRHIIMPLNN